METIVLDLGWTNLVVEKYEDNELSIYLQDKATSCITQDIAIVRQARNSDDEPAGEAVECFVWDDKNSEDYTNKFTIEKYVEAL